jgi:hypothetical protein
MLLAGIQAESGLDPRLKHSGVTILESPLFCRAAIFKGGYEEHEVKRKLFQAFVTFETFVVRIFFRWNALITQRSKNLRIVPKL